MDAGGFVSLDSPLARRGQGQRPIRRGGLIGSSTESSDNTFDLFVAIPAPARRGGLRRTLSTAVSLEFPGGSTANMRSTQFTLQPQLALGNLQTISVTGHAAKSRGRAQTQQVSGATYTIDADGSGTIAVGRPATRSCSAAAGRSTFRPRGTSCSADRPLRAATISCSASKR